MRLTEADISKVVREARGKTDHFEWDDDLPGFASWVREGKRTWIFQYKIGERQHRMKLGGPELNCKQARRLAQVQKGEVSKAKLGNDVDPAIIREKTKADAKPTPKGKTLGALIGDYLDAKVSALRPRS